MGRAKKPTDLKVLQGTFEKSRDIAPENMPQFTQLDETPVAPTHLDGEGRTEWERVAPELARCRVLRETDLQALAVYCEAVQQFHDATTEYRQSGSVMIMNSSGGYSKNPALTARKEATDTIAKYSAMLGLDPVSRSRLNVGKTDKDTNPFDDLQKPKRG